MLSKCQAAIRIHVVGGWGAVLGSGMHNLCLPWCLLSVILGQTTIFPLIAQVQAGVAASDKPAAALQTQRLFVRGEEGYHTFRIPSLLVTRRGVVLAFCEGRKRSASDTGEVDLVLKRSVDGGNTWSKLQVVWRDPTQTCGNPCPVLESTTGTVHLLMTWNRGSDSESAIIAQQSQDTRRVYVSESSDDGETWSRPREITTEVKPTHWTWYATGPGAGIQIEHGPKAGRLVVPCDHIEAGTRRYGSHVIYSDDRGKSWQLGGTAPHPQVNECEVVELDRGRLLLNMRNYDPAVRARQIALSADGGESWTGQTHVPELMDSICQASIRRYSWPTPSQPGRILFSNPASLKREKMTVRLSLDDGATWPIARVVDPRPSAYSCLYPLPDGTMGLFYEAGENSPYEELILARFAMDWLSEAKP